MDEPLDILHQYNILLSVISKKDNKFGINAINNIVKNTKKGGVDNNTISIALYKSSKIFIDEISNDIIGGNSDNSIKNIVDDSIIKTTLYTSAETVGDVLVEMFRFNGFSIGFIV